MRMLFILFSSFISFWILFFNRFFRAKKCRNGFSLPYCQLTYVNSKCVRVRSHVLSLSLPTKRVEYNAYCTHIYTCAQTECTSCRMSKNELFSTIYAHVRKRYFSAFTDKKENIHFMCSLRLSINIRTNRFIIIVY